MAVNDFIVNLVAGLSKTKSKQQIKSDAKSLGDMYVKLIGNLDIPKTRKAIKAQLKGLNNLTFNITPNVNTKGVQSATKQAINNAQKVANNNKVHLNFDTSKQQLVNQIKILGRNNNKLFNNHEMTAKYNQLLNAANVAKSTGELKTLRGELSAFKTELVATNNAGMTWGSKFKESVKSYTKFFSGASLVYAIANQVRNAATEAKTLDDSLVNLQKVTDEIGDRDALYKYFDKSLNKAQELNVKVGSLMDAVTEFKKLGWDLDDAELGAKWANILSNVGDVGIDTAIGSIKTSIASFDEIGGYGNDQMDKKLEAYTDLINNMSNKYSIDAEGLAESIRLSAGTLTEAHMSIEQAATMFATANKYYNDPSYLGNTAKIGSLRMRASSGDTDAIEELQEMGEEVDDLATATSNLREKLMALTGVDIMEDKHTFKSYYDQLYEISQVMDKLDDTSRANVLETMFGKSRSAAGAAILSGMKESASAYEDAINSAGSATEEYQTWMTSADAACQRFSNTLTETYQGIINGNTVRDLANLGSAVLEFANNWGIVEGTLKGVIALNLGKFIATGGMALITATKQVEQYGKALQMASNVPNGNLSARFQVLKSIAQATSTLTTEQLRNVLATNTLTQADRVRILQMQGMTKEMALQKLAEMNLTQATNAQTVANTASTASTFSLKAAMTGLGATLKSVFLSNPVGIVLMGISLGVSAVTSAVSKHNQAVEEARQKAKEAADAANTLGDEIATLANKYIQLSDAVKTDASAKEDLMTTQTELLKKLGLEGESIDDLIAKYGSLSNAIKQASIDSLKDQQIDLIAGVDAAREELIKAGKDAFGSDNWKKSIVAMGEEAGKAWQVLEDAGIISSGTHTDVGGEWFLSGDASEQGVLENYKTIENALEALRDSNKFTQEELSQNDLFKELYDRYNTVKEAAESYDSEIDNLNENLAQQTMLTALQGNELPKTEEDFNKFKQELIDTAVASKQFIGNEKEITDAINNYLSTVPEFEGYYSIPLENELDKVDELLNQEDFSKTLSDLFFSKDFMQYRKELTELENAGKLDESVLSSNEQYKKLIDETGLSAQDALKSIQAYIKELDGWSDGIDSIQSAYDTVTSAIEEYNKNGYFTLDTIQSLLSLDDAYLSMLFDENGNLVANEEAYKALANARLDDAEAEAVRQAMSDLQSITNEATALQYLEQEHYNTADSLYNLAGAYNEVAVAAQNALNKQGITTAETDAINGIMKTLDAKKSIIQQARDDVGKNSFKKVGGSDSSSKSSNSSKDKQASEMDFFKVRLEEIDNLISDVEAHMDNLTGASAKNISIDSLIDLNTQKQSNLKKGIEMYEEYTDILLNRIPSQYREAAKNGAIKLDSISDSNVKEAIDNYRTAASSLSDYTEQLEKLNGTLKQLQLDKFNNIADDFENQIGIIEDSVDKLQKIQDITSAKTKSESVDLYNQMSDETNKQLEYLQHEKDLLINQMNEAKSNGIDVASEEWFEMETTLEDVNDSILDCTSSLLDFSDAIKQIYIDNFDNVVSVFDEMNDKISSNIDTLQNLSDLQESRNKSTSRVYYDKMISQTELQIEKLYEERQKLQSALNEAVLNGVQVGDSDYADMVSQIESVTSSIVESKKSIEDYKQSIKDLYVTYFNNVSDNFSNQFDVIENANNILSSIADLADSQGSVAKTAYEQLMDNTTKQIDILNNKKKELADSLNDAVANGIEVGTDEWYEMYSAISECDNEILSAKKELVDFQDTLNELKWEQFNKVTDTFSHIGNQIQTVLQVIADEAKDIFSDENFDINNFLKNKGDFSELFTDEGKTTLGLYAQQYEMAVMENERYQKAVKELDKAYKDGEYTYEKYLEKLYELTEAQNEQSETIYSTKKAIQDLVKTALNAQVDAYSKLIDKQKESLSKEKEIYEHKKNLAQKEKEIAEIEAEIAARSGDDSSENQAEITQLQQELADKKSDMDDYLYDHSVSSQEEALDKSVTSAESRIKEYLSNTEKLLADTLEFTKTSANDIYNTITELANDYGISIDKSVIDSWKNSENAIASYEQQVNTSTSGFMNNLQIVENGIIREQEQTRIFTNELMTAFAVDPSQLNTNLDYIYGQIVNDKNGAYNFALQLMDTYATPDDVLIQNLNDISASLNNRVNDANTFGNALSSAYNVDPQSLYNNLNGIAVGLDKDRSYSEMLRDSLSTTFNADSYNISGLVNALNSVGDAAASMGAKISGATNDSLNNMALINKSLDSVRQATEGTLNIINQNMSAENALKDKLGLGNYKLVSESGKVIDLGYTKNSDALTQLEGHNNEVYKNGSNDYYRLQTYSNGGVVKDVDNPIFDKIARQLGEDHLVAVKNNELIIPPEKITELVKQYTIPQFNYTPPSLPNISDSIKTNSINVEVNYGGNMLNVEGSIDKSFAGELNNMANKVSDKIKKDLYKSGKLLGMHKTY